LVEAELWVLRVVGSNPISPTSLSGRPRGSGRDPDSERVREVEPGARARRIAEQGLELPGPARGDARARRGAEVDVVDERSGGVRGRDRQPEERGARGEGG